MTLIQNLYNNRQGITWVDRIVSQSTSFTALVNTVYLVDTTTGAITATLPNSPLEGSRIKFTDKKGNFSTNNLIIERSGTNTIIDEVNTTFTLNSDFAYLELVYSSGIWILVSANSFVDNLSFTPTPIWDGTSLSFDLTGNGLSDTSPVDLQGPAGLPGANGIINWNLDTTITSWVAGGDIQIAHGQGEAAKLIEVRLVCKNGPSNHGWSVGKEINTTGVAYTDYGFQSSSDATYVNINIARYGPIVIPANGGASATVLAADWNIRVLGAF
jgi:hypothetical protein